MTSSSMLSQLLKSKVPNQSEIELHLFEFCNLRCHFCGQDHDDKTGMHEIRSKIKRVTEFIAENPSKHHILNIMGGEIFNDQIEDSLFDEYLYFATEIHKFASQLGHSCQFNWVTNLVFTKTQRVEKLLRALQSQGIKTQLSTSYDFAGRKNKTWIADAFKTNLAHFKNDIYTIGFVLTRPAIQFLLESHDEYFEELYQHYPLYFDFYVPENGAAVLMPSDDEILQAYTFIAKNYPNVSPVKELLTNEMNKMTCYSLNKLTLLPNGREVKCRYLDYKPGDFKTELDYSSNDNIIMSFIEENQCLSCEWYDRCGFRCFVQADWAKRQAASECIFKTFFKEQVKI